jgi:multiple sugar transport system ATP-binding protein
MEISSIEETGADSFLYGTLAGTQLESLVEEGKEIVARVTTRRPPQRGEVVRLRVDPATVHVFDENTSERIS